MGSGASGVNSNGRGRRAVFKKFETMKHKDDDANVDLSYLNVYQVLEDEYNTYLTSKVDQNFYKEFLFEDLFPTIGVIDAATSDPSPLLEELKAHSSYGAKYSILGAKYKYAPLDTKHNEGLVDPGFVRKKLLQHKLYPNTKIKLPKTKLEFVQKAMIENGISAFSIKGNEKWNHTTANSIDYIVLFNEGMRIAVLTEGEGPYGPELSNYCCQRIVQIFYRLYMRNRLSHTVGDIMKQSIEELHHEVCEDDPNRPFDASFSGVAMIFTLLKPNRQKKHSFHVVTIGPMACYFVEKKQLITGKIIPSLTSQAPTIHANDIEERERIFKMGGEIRFDRDYRIYASGMGIPGARFSRAIGHKAGQIIGIVCQPSYYKKEIADAKLYNPLSRLKYILLSSQLEFLTNNQRLVELISSYKSIDDDLRVQLIGVMKNLEKNEHLYFDDFGLVYVFQN